MKCFQITPLTGSLNQSQKLIKRCRQRPLIINNRDDFYAFKACKAQGKNLMKCKKKMFFKKNRNECAWLKCYCCILVTQ